MRLTTPPSRAECHEIWEPKPPGTFWATSGLLRDSFTFYIIIQYYFYHRTTFNSNNTMTSHSTLSMPTVHYMEGIGIGKWESERDRACVRKRERFWGLDLPLSSHRRKPHCHRLSTLLCSSKAEKVQNFLYTFLVQTNKTRNLCHYVN
jgi:hypothetical protein